MMRTSLVLCGLLVGAVLMAYGAGAAQAVSAEPAGRPPVVIVNYATDAIVNYLQLEKPLGKGANREMVLAALRQMVDQYQGTGVWSPKYCSVTTWTVWSWFGCGRLHTSTTMKSTMAVR